ncbi:hypothetical protein [Citrobacter werkmanii]|uniref:hypothetical protein n=1 Tax=Citrobacter werkmanii TaxID=67827 RepID=UPI00264DA4E9|nr:hypothetical protein [Citrobacter werkmanii]MDN8558982.1 hypothetical protein [Citrobacter werkmanii]
MRIFHAATALSNGTNNNADNGYTFLPRLADALAMALKQSHFSVTGVTIDLSHNSQNQKSIANEKHQSNADLSLAGTTKTL